MIVVMRHADQRHAFGQAELPARESSACGSSVRDGGRRSRRLPCCAAVSGSAALPPAPSAPAFRTASDNPMSSAMRRCRRYRAPCCASVATMASIDRLRIFGGVLVAGKALFLVVDDQARAVRLRHLDQRHAGIVRAGRPEPGEIDRLAALPVARGQIAIRSSAKSEPS